MLAPAYDGIAGEFQLAVWFALESWAQAHADLARRLSTLVLRTGAWSNANQNLTAAILTKSANLDPAVVARMTRARWAERVDLALFSPVIATALKYGAITATVAPRELFPASLR